MPENAPPTPPGSDAPVQAPCRYRGPAFGPHGEGWVAAQIVLIVAIVVAGSWGPSWPATARVWLLVAGGVIGALGLVLFLAGSLRLGRQLTPFPRPTGRGDMRREGAYRLARHPIYGGVLLLGLAWALVSSPAALAPWALALPFFEFKRCREEAWLLQRYPGYDDYRRRVRRRFIPFVW